MADDSDKEDNKDSTEQTKDDNVDTASQSSSASETEKGKVAKLKGHLAGKHKDLWGWVVSHKKISIPAAAVLLLVLLMLVPFTRYALAGLFVKQNLQVTVVDSETNKPVTSATVRLQGVQALTNSQGKATLHVKVGNGNLEIAKQYYQTVLQDVTVPLTKPAPLTVKVKATGRQVPVTVKNKISGQPLADVLISADGGQVKTDKNGEAVIVLPPEKKEVKATITASGYNDSNVTITVTADKVAANAFTLTPKGKLYFLSNASGKLDVVKSDLDGTNRQTVLAGTGKEDRFNTVLLASRDWKYIALYSKRDGGDNPKLFLLDTSTDKLTTMDEGDATFELKGWSGDRFVYVVSRNKVQTYQPKRQALKSYQASTAKISVLDETAGEGDQYNYAFESLSTAYVLDNEVVYTKSWIINGYNTVGLATGKQDTFNSIRSDKTQKKVVKSYPLVPGSYASLDTRPADFGEIYIRFHNGAQEKASFEEYKDGKVETAKLDDNDFYNTVYPTYVVSPSSQKTLWADFRDGKNVIFVGNASGEDGKQVGSSQDYSTYGWYSDNYVLLTKKGSELHIMPASGLDSGVDASLKITDYYKPNYYIPGYGYGYGG